MPAPFQAEQPQSEARNQTLTTAIFLPIRNVIGSDPGTPTPAALRIFTLLYVYSPCEDEQMLAIRMDKEIEERLDRLAKKTGRTKTFYAREAILQHLEDLEDYYMAAEASRNPGKTFTGEEARSELGL